MSTPRPSPSRPPATSSPRAPLEQPMVRHGLAFAVAIVVPALLRILMPMPSPGTSLISFLLIVLGFGLMLVGVALYGWWEYVQLAHRDAEEWDHWRLGRGPAGFTRHPSWFGVMLFTLGQSLIGTTVWLLAWAVLVVVGLNLLVVRHDEPQLARTYGAEYEDYQARVSRWLPWQFLMQLIGGKRPR